MKLALFLTLLRLVLGPIFIVIYLYYQNLNISLTSLPYFLLSILIVCELTDILDGYVARKSGEVTELGKILDPMSDSIVRNSMFITFTQGLVKLPVLLVLLFIYRDSMISTLRTICALKGTTLSARASGKLKAVLQAIAIFLIVILMIPYSLNMISLESLQKISYYAVGLVAFYSVGSGIEYLLANKQAIKKSWVKSK